MVVIVFIQGVGVVSQSSGFYAIACMVQYLCNQQHVSYVLLDRNLDSNTLPVIEVFLYKLKRIACIIRAYVSCNYYIRI